MEAGELAKEGVSMGSAAIIVVLAVALIAVAHEWQLERNKARFAVNHSADLDKLLTAAGERNAQLEQEVIRLRKVSVALPPEKVDISVIKAKSAADVRRLTEQAFGLQPEIGEQNDIE